MLRKRAPARTRTRRGRAHIPGGSLVPLATRVPKVVWAELGELSRQKNQSRSALASELLSWALKNMNRETETDALLTPEGATIDQGASRE